MELSYFAAGKLLLFGEYLVLRDAKCLAIPLNVGQELTIKPSETPGISWEATENGKPWFNCHFSEELAIVSSNDNEKAIIAQQLLQLIRAKKKTLKTSHLHLSFNTTFERNFGFGTSSTLLSLLSQWTYLSPYYLLHMSFKGSGYDVAAATELKPFIYSMQHQVEEQVVIPECIQENILFVYTGQKQTSATEVTKFNQIATDSETIFQMNNIVNKAKNATTIEAWEDAMELSESLLSSILKRPKVKDELFDDYQFSIKSLGAWGGDFVMATFRSLEDAKNYFNSKNKTVYFTYQEIIRK